MAEEKNIIVEVLQTYLAGKLDPSTNFNPQVLAEALIQKIDFNRPINELGWEKVKAYKERLNESIISLDTEMKTELGKLDLNKPEEKLLANFVKGRIESYEEIADLIKKV
jgi:hypothetical protein